jgi:hypothetical protein
MVLFQGFAWVAGGQQQQVELDALSSSNGSSDKP